MKKYKPKYPDKHYELFIPTPKNGIEYTSEEREDNFQNFREQGRFFGFSDETKREMINNKLDGIEIELELERVGWNHEEGKYNENCKWYNFDKKQKIKELKKKYRNRSNVHHYMGFDYSKPR